MLLFFHADQELVEPASPLAELGVLRQAPLPAGGRRRADGVGTTSESLPCAEATAESRHAPRNATKRFAGERRVSSTQPSTDTAAPVRPRPLVPGQHAPPKTGGTSLSLCSSRVWGQKPNPICPKRASPGPQNVLVSSTALACLARGGKVPHNMSGRQLCCCANSILDRLSVTAGKTVLLRQSVQYIHCDQL